MSHPEPVEHSKLLLLCRRRFYVLPLSSSELPSHCVEELWQSLASCSQRYASQTDYERLLHVFRPLKDMQSHRILCGVQVYLLGLVSSITSTPTIAFITEV